MTFIKNMPAIIFLEKPENKKNVFLWNFVESSGFITENRCEFVFELTQHRSNYNPKCKLDFDLGPGLTFLSKSDTIYNEAYSGVNVLIFSMDSLGLSDVVIQKHLCMYSVLLLTHMTVSFMSTPGVINSHSFQWNIMTGEIMISHRPMWFTLGGSVGILYHIAWLIINGFFSFTE